MDKIQKIIDSGSFPSIIFLFGEEDFLVDEAYHKLMLGLVKNEEDEYNFDTLSGESTDSKTIAQMANAFPMITERRLVIVTNFNLLFPGTKPKKNDNHQALEKYIKNPQPSTVLILKGAPQKLNGANSEMTSPAKVDKFLKSLPFPYNFLLKYSFWIEFDKVKPIHYPNWVRQRLRLLGKTISEEALELLIAMTPTSLRDLDNEVNKLSAYAAEKIDLNIEDVTSIVGATREVNVFELQKAVADANLNRSLQLVEQMLSTAREEMKIISVLTRYFITLWKLSEIVRTETNSNSIASRAGVSFYFVGDYLRSLKKYNVDRIENAIEEICKAETTLKSSGTSSLVIIQNLIINIIPDGV